MNCSDPDSRCREVLEQLYAYIDQEETTLSIVEIRRHLEGCEPCVHEADIEAAIKKVVHRSCRCQPAPAELRVRIMTAIAGVQC